MATHDVTAPAIAAHGIDLATNVEEIVAFDRDLLAVEVVVHNANQPVYFTLDGSPAVVAGPRCRVLFGSGPNSAHTDLRRWVGTAGATAVTPTKVRLITAGSATVSVLDAG